MLARTEDPIVITGGILALDLGGIVGWAYGQPGGKEPEYGIWSLPHEGGEGARYAAFENELAETIDLYQPRHICVEAPLPIPALNSREAASQQYGLRAFTRAEAWRAGAAVHEIDSYSVRLAVIGTGRFARKEVKRTVVAWARRQGWDPPDHNAADALVIWSYYAHRLI